MVELEIKTPNLREDTHDVEWVTLVRLRVSGETIEIEGDESLIDFSIPVVSLRTGEPILFEQDREEWARNLPSAYRAGDYVVDVFRDDNPISPAELLGPELVRDEIELPKSAEIAR